MLLSSLRPALLHMNESSRAFQLSEFGETLGPSVEPCFAGRGDRAFLFHDEKVEENVRYVGLKRFLQPI